MASVVTERDAEIRGVAVRWVEVSVAGHIVEHVLSYEVAEAEAEYGLPFSDKMDRYIQLGMFATDRIAVGGAMHKVASATSYVLDGKCIRTAKIEHCEEVAPSSCGPGTPPIAHSELTRAGASGVPEYRDFSEYE